MKKAFLKKTGVVLLSAAAAISLLAGCGSSGSSSKSGAKVIKVATGQANAPYFYADDDGKPAGYDVDVLKAIDEKLDDYDFDIQNMDFSTCIVSLDSGAVDMVSHELVKSEEREKKYIFPDKSYCMTPLSLCVKKDSGITNMADMAGKSIHIDPTCFEYTALTDYNESHPDATVNLITTADVTAADEYKGVSTGSWDACLAYNLIYKDTIDKIGITDTTLTDTVLVEQMYQMIRPELTDFRDAFSKALDEIIEDGTLSKLNEQWFGEDYYSELASKTSYDLSVTQDVAK